MIGSGSLPFDCNAAINNFFRVAWPVLTDAPSVRECAWVVDMYSIRSYAPSLPGKTVVRLGPRRRSTGAAPSRERAARATTRLPSMPATAWSGSTSRPVLVHASWRLVLQCMAGERLLDMDGGARPRAESRQPAL